MSQRRRARHVASRSGALDAEPRALPGWKHAPSRSCAPSRPARRMDPLRTRRPRAGDGGGRARVRRVAAGGGRGGVAAVPARPSRGRAASVRRARERRLVARAGGARVARRRRACRSGRAAAAVGLHAGRRSRRADDATVGPKLRPKGRDERLPWPGLASMDAVFFVAGDIDALVFAPPSRCADGDHARAGVSTARRLVTSSTP